MRNEKGNTKIVATEIKYIIRKHYKQLYANNLYNLREMGKFLET